MTESYQPFQQGPWRGVIAQGFRLPAADLDAWLAELGKHPKAVYPSRMIARYDATDGACFVKTICGANDRLREFWSRLKWRFRPSKALHVWKISGQLAAAGIACPPVLLAARKRAWRPWGWPTDLVITREAPGLQLTPLLQNAPDKTALLSSVARALARFHAAGFIHGDCQPWNLFWDEASHQLCFIDNDRTQHCSGARLSAGIRRNLVQMGFHLRRKELISPAELEGFFQAYAPAALTPELQHRIDERLRTES